MTLEKYTIKIYEPSDYSIWNAFISSAKNATFLFHRDYISYHKSRFEDYSLLVYKNDLCVALLPANVVGTTVFSHQGLSYGGLVYNEYLNLEAVIACFEAVLVFLTAKGMDRLHCKTMPSFYHKKPAEEILYALFLAKGQLVRRDSLAVLDLTKDFAFSALRKRGIQKAIKNNLIIKEETNFEPFWNQILIPNLATRHQVNPVHSLEEIVYLKNKFPNNIRQFNVYCKGQIVAGTTIFETETTAHCQYISKFEKEKNSGSLDFLYYYLIHDIFSKKHYFDFGSSNENQGKDLNGGLSLWKESFGASTIIQDFYEIETANYEQLKTAVI